MNRNHLTLFALVALTALLCGVALGRKIYDKPCFTETRIDTLTIRDTIEVVDSPPTIVIPDGLELVPAGTALALANTEEALERYRDSLAVKPAIVTVHDTSYIVVPMSEYHFTDNKTYDMAVRGYDVSLLWHKSFQETKYITETRTITEYSNYALTIHPQISTLGTKGLVCATVGVGADILVGSKGFIRFEPEVGYGYFYAEQSLLQGVYAGASLKFDLIRVKRYHRRE